MSLKKYRLRADLTIIEMTFLFSSCQKKKKNRTDSFRPFPMHYGENLPTYSPEMNTQLDPVLLQFCFVLFFLFMKRN